VIETFSDFGFTQPMPLWRLRVENDSYLAMFWTRRHTSNHSQRGHGRKSDDGGSQSAWLNLTTVNDGE
jgi:hypothetical protein